MDAPEFVAPIEVPLPQIAPELVVREADIAQIAKMLTVAAPVVTTLMELPPSLIDRLVSREGDGEGDEQVTVHDIAELYEVLSRHPFKLIEMVAIATRLDIGAVGALPPDRFAFLFAVVVQVNVDFFSRATQAFAAAGRVLQQLRDRALSKAGPAPSIS